MSLFKFIRLSTAISAKQQLLKVATAGIALKSRTPLTTINRFLCNNQSDNPYNSNELDCHSGMSYYLPIPLVRSKAPDFSTTSLINGEFKQISLKDYKGKYIVLFFYPMDFTFVCPTEIVEFSDRAKEFEKLNCQVLGCSTDSHFNHLAWTKVARNEGGLGNINIPLLADKNMSISSNYGVLLADKGISLRGLFIIDDNGIVRHSTINDLNVGRNVDEALRLVSAFQFSDKNGELCPIGWSSGKKAIVDKPGEHVKYFKQ